MKPPFKVEDIKNEVKAEGMEGTNNLHPPPGGPLAPPAPKKEEEYDSSATVSSLLSSIFFVKLKKALYFR